MEALDGLELDYVGVVGGYYGGDGFKAVFYYIEEYVGEFVGVGADYWNVEKVVLVFLELFFYHGYVELGDLGEGL